MKNLANILTGARLLLLPLIIVLFFIPYAWAAWTCLALYVIGAATDYLDGWVARRYGQVSEFGKLIDPVSDKIFVVTVMLMLVAVGRLDGAMVLTVVIIIAREFVVAGLREFLGQKDAALPVTPLAKWKTASQMTALALLIVGPYVGWAYFAGAVLLIAATVLTVITGWQYWRTALAYLKG